MASYLAYLWFRSFSYRGRSIRLFLTLFGLISQTIILNFAGWSVCKRNAHVIINDPGHITVEIGAAQYGMLVYTPNQDVVSSESCLQNVVASSHSQERVDEEYDLQVLWSRHQVSCIVSRHWCLNLITSDSSLQWRLIIY